MARTRGSGSKGYPLLKEIDFAKTTAVQNTYYAVLNASNVDVVGICFGITDTGENLQIRVTIDGGTAYVCAATACNAGEFITPTGITISTVPGTAQSITVAASAASVALNDGSRDDVCWMKGQSVKIEVQKTSNNGAGDLVAYGFYHQG